MTQDQLGRQLGLAFQQIQKYETGENRLSAGRLFRIAGLLGVPVSFFFDEAPETGPRRPADSDGAAGRALMALLSSPEGLALNNAYRAIRDPQIRRSLLELLRTLAGDG